MFSFFKPKPPPPIVPLDVDRATDCARIHAAFFSHPWSSDEFAGMIASVNHFCDGAIEEPSGRLSGFVVTRRAVDEAEILTIAVDKSAQGRGIGRELLRSQAEILRRHGVRRLLLEVDEKNAPARKLYGRFGFLQVGSRPGYYRTPAGQPANALILAVDL